MHKGARLRAAGSEGRRPPAGSSDHISSLVNNAAAVTVTHTDNTLLLSYSKMEQCHTELLKYESVDFLWIWFVLV